MDRPAENEAVSGASGPRFTRRGALKAGIGGAAVAAVGLGAYGISAAAASTSGTQREYWIQVDSFEHNLVPSGIDPMSGTVFNATDAVFQALGYRAYSENWGHPLAGSDDIGPNTGIPGPIIRASVGDTVVVHFRNNDSHYQWPHSMHTHGFQYTPDSDGAYVNTDPTLPGRAVAYGDTYTYTWVAKPNSVGTWPYHDHSVMQGISDAGPLMEFNAELGMFGHVAITDDSTLPVDREFFLFFHDVYQADVPSLVQDFDCFNGVSYMGNTPTYTAKVGDRVRWRVTALGKEFHVFHLHGHRWQNDAGRFVDAEILGPSTALTVEYTEDNPGNWLYHCHVTDHMAGGMVGQYNVTT